jgi:hypothetical protein
MQSKNPRNKTTKTLNVHSVSQKEQDERELIRVEINRARQKLRVKEMKDKSLSNFFQVVLNAQAITATGLTQSLSNIPQGSANGTRTGDRAYPKRLQVRYSISSPDLFNTTRLIFFRWRQNLGVTPTQAQILDNGVGGVPGPYSMYNFSNRESIDVIYDKVWFTVGGISSTSSNVGEVLNFILPSRPISFTPGTVVGNDKIYLLMISDSVAAPDPTLSINSYLWFEDEEL